MVLFVWFFFIQFLSLLFFSLYFDSLLIRYFFFASVSRAVCSQAGCRRRTNSTKYICYGLVYKNIFGVLGLMGFVLARAHRRAVSFRYSTDHTSSIHVLRVLCVTQTSKCKLNAGPHSFIQSNERAHNTIHTTSQNVPCWRENSNMLSEPSNTFKVFSRDVMIKSAGVTERTQFLQRTSQHLHTQTHGTDSRDTSTCSN